MKEWSPLGVFMWLLVVLGLLGAGSPGETAVVSPAEVELEPPLAALTFDDGPRRDTTAKLLDGLALRELPATFFLIGDQIEGNEDLVCRMKAEGHQVGVHTRTHVMLRGVTHQEYSEEVDGTRRLLRAVLGEGAYWLRPPYGIVDERILQWEPGPLVMWSVDPEDWKDRNVQRIVDHVLNKVRDGSIILMHDIYPSSVEAALELADLLTDRGYCFVTVEQLMELRGEEAAPGKRVVFCPVKD